MHSRRSLNKAIRVTVKNNNYQLLLIAKKAILQDNLKLTQSRLLEYANQLGDISLSTIKRRWQDILKNKNMSTFRNLELQHVAKDLNAEHKIQSESIAELLQKFKLRKIINSRKINSCKSTQEKLNSIVDNITSKRNNNQLDSNSRIKDSVAEQSEVTLDSNTKKKQDLHTSILNEVIEQGYVYISENNNNTVQDVSDSLNVELEDEIDESISLDEFFKYIAPETKEEFNGRISKVYGIIESEIYIEWINKRIKGFKDAYYQWNQNKIPALI